jgi:hypothetical protein
MVSEVPGLNTVGFVDYSWHTVVPDLRQATGPQIWRFGYVAVCVDEKLLHWCTCGETLFDSIGYGTTERLAIGEPN